MNEQEFWSVLQNMPQPKPLIHRLYYKEEDGSLICFSMDELPYNYIDVSQEVYSRSPVNVRVIDGKMIEIAPASYVKKLKPNLVGTPCDPRDICIVVPEIQEHIKWSIVHNETD
jgi:hypothetical protein